MGEKIKALFKSHTNHKLFFFFLFFFAASVQEPRGILGVPRDISSPITSDEEYLSPLEEGIDFGGVETKSTIPAHFRKPPVFLVSLGCLTTALNHYNIIISSVLLIKVNCFKAIAVKRVNVNH